MTSKPLIDLGRAAASRRSFLKGRPSVPAP